MHSAEIQCELKKRGITQRAIAEELGICPFHVSAMIRYPVERGGRGYILKAIAKKIDRDHREVFPSYFFRKNRRIKKSK